MTRKQELYEILLHHGFVLIRNQQSQCKFSAWWRLSPWKWKRVGTLSYEVAQFLHNVPPVADSEEFGERDLRFLNVDARSFFEQMLARSFGYSFFFSPVKQLFDLVPEGMKDQLEWDGPQMPELSPAEHREVDGSLFWAVEHNVNVETLRSALACGADVNARDDKGRTALTIAAQVGNEEYGQILKSLGGRE